MFDLILEPENLPFALALGLVLALSLLEVLGALFGATLSAVVDDLLPKLEVDLTASDGAAGADGGVNAASAGPVALALAWLSFGQVPALVILILFLFYFGVAGLAVQALVHQNAGSLMPSWFAAIPALAVALPALRHSGRALGRLLPARGHEAISTDSLAGQIAIVTLGEAAAGRPAEARVSTPDGTQYVRVEPRDPAARFVAGARVRLILRRGNIFQVDAA